MEGFPSPSPGWPAYMGRPFNGVINHAVVCIVTLYDEKGIVADWRDMAKTSREETRINCRQGERQPAGDENG